jgi:hypothetical protein
MGERDGRSEDFTILRFIEQTKSRLDKKGFSDIQPFSGKYDLL